MNHYRWMPKTTMGRRYRMRVPDNAVAERRIYWVVVTVLPAMTVALFAAVWMGVK